VSTFPPDDRRRNELLAEMHLELVPSASLDVAAASLAAESQVSVTCSPARDIEETVDVAVALAGRGHRVTPHLAARMIVDADHFERLVHRLAENDVRRIFVIGGDAEEPRGPYSDARQLLERIAESDVSFSHIGFAGYPHGHPAIELETLRRALAEKQQLVDAAGARGFITTQLCFDPEVIAAWIDSIRRDGVDVPVHLGMAGVVTRSRLMRMAMQLGVGPTIRYLRKNRASAASLMTGTYRPDILVEYLLPRAGDLNITALHCFTFNEVAETLSWAQRAIASTTPFEP
jgi:methylenetetrahydrofolate reductase (NADPH)